MRLLSPYRISVVIPTYYPGEDFRKLLERLRLQTLLPDEILIINTEAEGFRVPVGALPDGARVMHIAKESFDHGGTRDLAFQETTGDIVVCMTQDAVPADRCLLEQLLLPFEEERVGVSYARQIPRKDSDPIEAFTRRFNYGKESRIKTAEDLPALGIKAFFCSNVCAAWRRSAYDEAGGFEKRTIFNEDMILAGKLLRLGWHVAYQAQARVIHAHHYTGKDQLRRNFDLGVSQAQHPEIFREYGSVKEGTRLVRGAARSLLAGGHAGRLPVLFWQSGCKYAGFFLGKHYRQLPKWLIRRISMNRTYWESFYGR